MGFWQGSSRKYWSACSI